MNDKGVNDYRELKKGLVKLNRMSDSRDGFKLKSGIIEKAFRQAEEFKKTG